MGYEDPGRGEVSRISSFRSDFAKSSAVDRVRVSAVFRGPISTRCLSKVKDMILLSTGVESGNGETCGIMKETRFTIVKAEAVRSRTGQG